MNFKIKYWLGTLNQLCLMQLKKIQKYTHRIHIKQFWNRNNIFEEQPSPNKDIEKDINNI